MEEEADYEDICEEEEGGGDFATHSVGEEKAEREGAARVVVVEGLWMVESSKE